MTTTKQLAEKLLELRSASYFGKGVEFKITGTGDPLEETQEFIFLCSSHITELCTAYLKLEEENEKLLGAKLAYYMMPDRLRIGKTTRAIIDMVQQMRPNSEIKVTTPDVEKLESDLEKQKKINSKLEKQLEVCKANYKQLATSCEWYADKGTEQERHHFLKVEAIGNYESDMQELEKVEG